MIAWWWYIGGWCALSASPMPLAYILVRRRDLINVMEAWKQEVYVIC